MVVDDVVTVSPWWPRGVEVRGFEELRSEGGRAHVKVTPSQALLGISLGRRRLLLSDAVDASEPVDEVRAVHGDHLSSAEVP